MKRPIFNSTFKEIGGFLSEKIFESVFLSSLFFNVLPLVKCFSDWNKWKFVGVKFGEYGEYGRISHPYYFIFSLVYRAVNIKNKGDLHF